MYFPTSAALIEFLILAILEQGDSYGYEISQTIKLIAKIKESTLYPYILSRIPRSDAEILLLNRDWGGAIICTQRRVDTLH